MLVPTKKGLCPRPVECRALKSHITKIKEVIPELELPVPCFMCDDNMNQLGMLRSRNPLKYVNW